MDLTETRERERERKKDPYDDEVDEVREGVDHRDQEERQQARDAYLAKHIHHDVSIAPGSAGRGGEGRGEGELSTSPYRRIGSDRKLEDGSASLSLTLLLAPIRLLAPPRHSRRGAVVADPCDENAIGDKDWRGEERRDKGDNGICLVVGVEVVAPDPAA